MTVDTSTTQLEPRPRVGRGDPQGGGRRFLRALRYEWASLRTLRSPWVLGGVALALQLAAVLLQNRTDTPGIDQYTNGLSQTILIVPTVLAAVAINAFGSDYRFGTVTTTVLTLQSRTSVVLAKATVTALFVAVFGACAVLLQWLSVPVLGNATVAAWPATVSGLASMLYVVGMALVGLALAGLSRSSVLSLAVVILWPTVLETLAVQFSDISPEKLPFTAVKQLIHAPTDPQWSMLLPLTVTAAVLVTVTAVTFSRRDV